VSAGLAPRVAGRAIDAARSTLKAALGSRMRAAGPDRTEALAQDGTVLAQQPEVTVLGGALRVVEVRAPHAAHFEGFLDGIQRSATIAYVDGVPLLHGTAAAAIRERDHEGRMRTWRSPLVHHAVYASRQLLDEATWAQMGALLETRGQLLVDADDDLTVASRHPSALLRQGMDALSKMRDTLERNVGDMWCDPHADRLLYVDGSLRTSHAMLRSPGAVGVVKSHATLYVPDEQFSVIASLQAAQRSSVLLARDASKRPKFYTWYLRLRNADGRDPFFGLIRAECGVRDMSESAAEAHADAASTWLLAERAPLARPDARWDVMPYAVRDCEVYLRAVA
jgi:hypothetical protein